MPRLVAPVPRLLSCVAQAFTICSSTQGRTRPHCMLTATCRLVLPHHALSAIVSAFKHAMMDILFVRKLWTTHHISVIVAHHMPDGLLVTVNTLNALTRTPLQIAVAVVSKHRPLTGCVHEVHGTSLASAWTSATISMQCEPDTERLKPG